MRGGDLTLSTAPSPRSGLLHEAPEQGFPFRINNLHQLLRCSGHLPPLAPLERGTSAERWALRSTCKRAETRTRRKIRPQYDYTEGVGGCEGWVGVPRAPAEGAAPRRRALTRFAHIFFVCYYLALVSPFAHIFFASVSCLPGRTGRLAPQPMTSSTRTTSGREASPTASL